MKIFDIVFHENCLHISSRVYADVTKQTVIRWKF